MIRRPEGDTRFVAPGFRWRFQIADGGKVKETARAAGSIFVPVGGRLSGWGSPSTSIRQASTYNSSAKSSPRAGVVGSRSLKRSTAGVSLREEAVLREPPIVRREERMTREDSPPLLATALAAAYTLLQIAGPIAVAEFEQIDDEVVGGR
jgi:hypothetical protein